MNQATRDWMISKASKSEIGYKLHVLLKPPADKPFYVFEITESDCLRCRITPDVDKMIGSWISITRSSNFKQNNHTTIGPSQEHTNNDVTAPYIHPVQVSSEYECPICNTENERNPGSFPITTMGDGSEFFHYDRRQLIRSPERMEAVLAYMRVRRSDPEASMEAYGVSPDWLEPKRTMEECRDPACINYRLATRFPEICSGETYRTDLRREDWEALGLCHNGSLYPNAVFSVHPQLFRHYVGLLLANRPLIWMSVLLADMEEVMDDVNDDHNSVRDKWEQRPVLILTHHGGKIDLISRIIRNRCHKKKFTWVWSTSLDTGGYDFEDLIKKQKLVVVR